MFLSRDFKDKLLATIATAQDGKATFTYTDESLIMNEPEQTEDGENANGEDGTGVVSFLDERNTDTASVQFVISTDGISAPEQPVEDQPEAESQGFFADLWDKIVALFT